MGRTAAPPARRLRAAVCGLLLAATAGTAPAAGRSSEAKVLADPARPLAERLDAVRALAASPRGPARDGAIAALSAALSDPSPELRVLATDALGELGAVEARPLLVAGLPREADPRAKAALLLGIGRLGGEADVPVVALFADDADPRLRAATATALGDLGGAVARARLLRLLGAPGPDPDWAVRGAVFLALSKAGRPEDAGTVLVAYREGGGANRWFARAALASAVAALDPDPVPILDRLAGDDDGRVSSAAVAAFARARRPEEILKRLDDPRPGVRAAAAAAVGRVRIDEGVPRVRAMAAGDADRAVRFSAALALSRLDDPAGDELLVAAVDADDPGVWTLALAELRRRTGLTLGRDPAAWREALAERRAAPR